VPPAPSADVSAPPIFSRQLILLLLAEFGLLAGFYLLISVVPLYAARAGAADVGAGLATGAMMMSTVLTELAVPGMLARYGYRAVLAAGALLLGAPALILAASPGLPLILAVCLARGIGLGIVVVSGSALTAELVPAERRSEGLGIYGVAVSIPSVLGLPLGVWLSQHVGFGPVFLAGAAVALAAAVPVCGLPALPDRSEGGPGAEGGSPGIEGVPGAGSAPGAEEDVSSRPERVPGRSARGTGILRGLQADGLGRPVLVFAATTLANGVVVTFLPLALPARSAPLASIALLAFASTTPVARWAAGRYGDQHGSGRLLIPAAAASALGMAGLVLVRSPAAILAGMALFGIGFGAAQNVTLALMMERVPRAGFGRASALWNMAYDAGIGAGALGFGLLVDATGYRAGFALTTAVLLAALVPAWRDRASSSASRAGHAASPAGHMPDG
jgi:predicted MFS family arabinose efflux permease